MRTKSLVAGLFMTGLIPVALALPVGAAEARFADTEAKAYEAACLADYEAAKAALENLEKYDGPETVATVFRPFDELLNLIVLGANKAQIYRYAHPDEAMREAATACEQKFSDLNTVISLSRPLYDNVAAVDVSGADAATGFYMSETLNEFRRAGVDKDDATRARIRALQEEIVKIGQDFAKNIATDTRSITLDSVEDLEGLPEDYIEAHPPGEDGKITVTTNYPDMFPFLTYAANDDARRALRVADRSRGYPGNEAVLKNLLTKRHELAGILGFPDYATFITGNKMIENPANADAFLNKVTDIVVDSAARDKAVLLTRLRQIDPDATSVQVWQHGYLSELVRREQYAIDAKLIRQYFEYDRVRDGIFKLMGDLFGVEIRPWDTSAWDEAVESYELWDGGELIGRFHLDMHPRENKFKHAANFGLVPGIKGRQLPVSALVTNFPGGGEGSGLMEHSQVITFLHEFGHLMHELLGGHTDWVGTAGVATEWDFVEAPSQMLEEWGWHPETLQTFAVNDEGETIPDDLVRKMVAARFFGQGITTKTQMYYAALSLNYYSQDPADFELMPVLRDLMERYSPYPYVEGTHFYANFGHLDGYSAIYYTYMWSKSIALDMFSEFEAGGMGNAGLARRYRETVLNPGGTKKAADLVRDFLGRPYNLDAFMRRLNETADPA